MYVEKKKIYIYFFFTKPISDYGKMLKYWEKYRSITSGSTWPAVVRPVGCTAKFSETSLETAYGIEINIQFTGNSSGGHSCSDI